MKWLFLDYRMTIDHLGFIPSFLSEDDSRSAAQQIDSNYACGGGWHPLPDWKMIDKRRYIIKYPGDPALKPLAMTILREETILFYQHDVLCIVQKDGSFEAARVD
jgi:hypothetical protein